jgi:diguanylate cyclase (GGDEF)-like protein
VDELTGLLNHKAFPHELKESMEGAKRDKKPLSVIFFDIDNFKMINEQYLMQGGDDIMRQIGAYLTRDSRASDITCRQHLKGDEFIIIAKGTTKDQARMAAERKRNEIQNLGFQVNQKEIIKITMSAGIAEFEWEKDNIDSLVNKANKALITAKNNGKNCSIIYNQ